MVTARQIWDYWMTHKVETAAVVGITVIIVGSLLRTLRGDPNWEVMKEIRRLQR